jgi:hypothetical protein
LSAPFILAGGVADALRSCARLVTALAEAVS